MLNPFHFQKYDMEYYAEIAIFSRSIALKPV